MFAAALTKAPFSFACCPGFAWQAGPERAHSMALGAAQGKMCWPLAFLLVLLGQKCLWG